MYSYFQQLSSRLFQTSQTSAIIMILILTIFHFCGKGFCDGSLKSDSLLLYMGNGRIHHHLRGISAWSKVSCLQFNHSTVTLSEGKRTCWHLYPRWLLSAVRNGMFVDFLPTSPSFHSTVIALSFVYSRA